MRSFLPVQIFSQATTSDSEKLFLKSLLKLLTGHREIGEQMDWNSDGLDQAGETGKWLL